MTYVGIHMRINPEGSPDINYLVSRNNMLQDLVAAGGMLALERHVTMPNILKGGILATSGFSILSAAYQGLQTWGYKQATNQGPVKQFPHIRTRSQAAEHFSALQQNEGI